MIKIYLADNIYYKTTKQLKDYWEQDPRFTLITDPYFNPVKAEWADVIWIEWTEGTMAEASIRKGEFKGVISDHKQIEQTKFDWTGKVLINRMIDIEAYFGHFRQVQWQNVDYLTYIAKHVYNMVDKEVQFKKTFPKLGIKHIPLGINLNDWKYKKRDGKGRNIAWVNHIWTGKGYPLMLQAFKKLIDVSGDKSWKLYIIGNWSTENWLPPYTKHIIKELRIEDNVIIGDRVQSVDDFLEGMDYLVSSSYKEAFSLILAEAMAKGIKTVTHNWIGSTDIWPKEMVWTTIDDFVEKMLADDYDSEKYRTLAEGYDKKFEIEAANQIMNV